MEIFLLPSQVNKIPREEHSAMAGARANFFPPHFFFFLISLLLLSCSEISKSKAQMVPAMYVFGDSLVDVGNNNYLPVSFAKANFPHNGIDFPTKKPTGRFCNGKNAADLLAEKVGLPTSPPYLGLLKAKNASFVAGVSFASGGAGIFNGSDQTFGQSIPLTKQVSNYISVYGALEKTMGPAGVVEKHLAKSLFVIVIGSNDLFGYFGKSKQRDNYTPQQYVDLMLTSLNQQLKKLYSYGARKFILAGIGMIGCAPAQRLKNETQECFAEANFWATKYNAGLKSMLQQLKMELNGFSYSYFDTFLIMQNIIQNPSSYGFNEVKAACCGLGELRANVPCLPISKYCSNRRDHAFWDFYHPTEATDTIMADNIFEGSPTYTQPMNVRQLIAI